VAGEAGEAGATADRQMTTEAAALGKVAREVEEVAEEEEAQRRVARKQLGPAGRVPTSILSPVFDATCVTAPLLFIASDFRLCC
jgi:hypothetical protein